MQVEQERQLEGDTAGGRHGQPDQLEQPGQRQTGGRAGRGDRDPGAPAGHPDVAGVDEDRGQAEVQHQARRRHFAADPLRGERVTELVQAQRHHVEQQQGDRAEQVGIAGQEERVAAVAPGEHEQHRAGQRQQGAEPDRRPGEEQLADAVVEAGQHAVDRDRQRPSATGRLLRRRPAQVAQRPERVPGEVLQHPVAGQVGDDPADLVGGETAGDPGELGDQPGHRAGAVHHQGQLVLLRAEPEVAAAAAVVGRAEHHVAAAADRGTVPDLDAAAQLGTGAGRVEPIRDGVPETGVGGAGLGARGPAGQCFPDVGPGLDIRQLAGPLTPPRWRSKIRRSPHQTRAPAARIARSS